LRIRFLPYNTTVGDVQELCRRFGTTTSIELNKSVALANFSKQSEALLAIYTLEASQFRGNTLRVDFAREPREQKKPEPTTQQNQGQQQTQQQPQQKNTPAPVAEKVEPVRFSAQQQLANPPQKQQPKQQQPKQQQQQPQQQRQQQNRPNQPAKGTPQKNQHQEKKVAAPAPARKFKVTVESESESVEKITVTISQEQYSKFIIPLMHELLSSTK